MEIHVDKVALGSFAREYGAKFVVLYGSYATAKAGKSSDVDVAVYFEPGLMPDSSVRYGEIAIRLGEALGVSASSIDFVVLNKANILLRYEITAKGRLLFGDESDYAQYGAFAFREYHDARPLFALEELLIRKRQEMIRRAAAAPRV